MVNDSASQSSDSASGSSSASPLRRHSRYWLDDGSLVIRTQNDLFKVHRTLLHRHSPVLSSIRVESSSRNQDTMDGCPVVHLPDELGVQSADFEALLEHLYHDIPLDSDTEFPRVASIFRASSKKQLDFPSIHRLARRQLEGMFPSEPVAFFEVENPDEALTLAVEYDIYPIQKTLFYTLATHQHMEHDEPEGAIPNTTTPPAISVETVPVPRFNLTPELTSRCQTLLNELVAHFTPVLFTVATAGHMACTDVFAETWMPLVIQPALENNGLCRPLETLQTIIELDWCTHGMCEKCVQEKREEWRGEQKAVWERMDHWLKLPRQ